MFYEQGIKTAFEQLGMIKEAVNPGLLKSTWQGMQPAAQGLAKRLGAGAAVGGTGGAIAGGEDNRLSGALLGAAAGAGGLAGAGHLMRRGVRKQVAGNVREVKQLAREQGLKGTPYGRAMLDAQKPALAAAESRILPRLTEKDLAGVGERYMDAARKIPV